MSSSDAKLTSQLQAIKSALSFENYRNAYEATNSYAANVGNLNSIEETMKIAIAASGPTEGQKMILADVKDLQKMWEQKKVHREQSLQQREAMLNVDANKAEWLKQLKAEEEADEKEAKQAHDSKTNAKKKRAQERKDKRNQRRGGDDDDDSDSDEEESAGAKKKGSKKGSKGRHAGMERGSSLLAQLAGDEGEDEVGESKKGGRGAKNGGSNQNNGQQQPADFNQNNIGATTTTPQVLYRNVPLSLIPKSLLELVNPEDEDDSTSAAASKQVLCTVQNILNSPMVELTFTLPYKGSLPEPRRVIALNHQQQQDIHQPFFQHLLVAAKGGEADEEGGGGKKVHAKAKGGKQQEKEPQIRFGDLDLPACGPEGFVVKVTMWRVVVASHLSEYKHVVTPVPEAVKVYLAGQEKKIARVKPNKPQKKVEEGGVGGRKNCEQEDDQEEDEDEDDDEMVLQHTPDDFQEHLNQLLGEEEDVEEDGEEEEEVDGSGKKRKKNSVLDEMSSQLVAQYREDEAAEEEDEYLRHAKARDIPSTIIKSMPHWHPLSESTWVILMCHGGHFAGAVFVNGRAILHKAFHRYVVRKGQGGKQSKHLKGGGANNSVGGKIRYAQELKWKSEVRDIILLWKEHIQQANMILYVAPGPDNRQILTEWKDTPQSQLSRNLGPLATTSPIQLKDPRVRSVPYTTGRPTFGEVTTIFETLSGCHIGFYRSDGKDGGAYTGHRNSNYAVDFPGEEAFYF